MEGQTQQSQVSEESLKRGHDGYTPVSVRAFVIALMVFVAIAVAIYLSVYGLMQGFATYQDKGAGRRASPLATTQPVPPQPWIQPSIAQGDEPRQPWQDMQAFRAHEDAILNSYSKLDSTTGAARIPIDRAMHLVAEHAVPTSQPSTSQPASQSASAGGGK